MDFPDLPKTLRPQRDTCLEQLRTLVQQPNIGMFAIIDLAAVTDARMWFGYITARLEGINLFTGQPEEAAQQQAPWLVKIQGQQDRSTSILRRSVNEAMLSQGVTWLQSTLPFPELAARMARRMSAQTPDGDALLRYYDARLLPTVWATLSDSQRRAFGAIGTTWWTLDASLTVQHTALPGAQPYTDDPFAPPVHYDQQHMDAVLRVSEHHQLVDFLCKRQPDQFATLDRAQRLQFVQTHDTAARDRHVTHFADRLRYCELALRHGEDFADDDHWQPVWAALQHTETRLQAAMQQIEEPAAKPG